LTSLPPLSVSGYGNEGNHNRVAVRNGTVGR